jgi:hypothetical protein
MNSTEVPTKPRLVDAPPILSHSLSRPLFFEGGRANRATR